MIWLVALLWSSATALAGCDEPYTASMLQDSVALAEAALSRGELPVAKRKLKTVGERLVCLETIADPGDLARFGRQMGLVAFYSQDEISAVRWLSLSAAAQPDLPWLSDLGPEHPFRELANTLDKPPIGGPSDATLAPPKHGGIFLDGELLLTPRAPAEVPHLVQLFDSGGRLVQAYWQDGAAFPDAVLGPADAKLKPPRWYKGDPVDGGGGSPGSASPLPIVPIATGGGLVVVSGILYAAALGTKGSLAKAKQADDLTKIRSTANALTLGATVLGLAGVGIGVSSVVLLDGHTVGVHLRF